ncbi:hypothetical protein OG792_06740 [Micromonospora sp. NBC_01699]|uniref:hypothetical protein n=1 Tax=Micromonospora sp. NBC_01699 TaxID=2975984 RepID=UPI002E35302E|nr:hypothetical protein [Micromonospora sp. NBC_01699]
MALVRRASVLDNAGQLVVTAVSRVAAAQADTVTSTPVTGDASTAAGNDASTAAGNPDRGQPVGADAEAPAEAASVTSQQAGLGAVIAAFATIAAGGYGAWQIWSSGGAATIIQPPDTTAVFGTLLVFAAAVERVLEPFSRWFPGRRTEAALEQSIVALANRTGNPTHADLAAVAHAKAQVERARGNRTIVAWGIATAVATVASSAGGFYVLHAIAGPEWDGLPVWVDAIVTGVMVGSGTKPVHDIISRVQGAKEQAQNPTA